MRSTSWKAAVAGIALAGAAGLFVRAFVMGRKELAREQDRERPIEAPTRVSIKDGESVVTLDSAAQSKAGLVMATLKRVSRQEEVQAYGTILQLRGLMDLQNTYIVAKAKADTMRVTVEASRKEYDRLKVLHENQNVSAKVFQAAEAKWRTDAANAGAAQQALRVLESTVRQRWGEVIANWLFDNAPALNRLVQQEEVLIQVTLPLGAKVLSPPETARVQVPAGALSAAKLVSVSPQTDPRIQGKSFFYIASAEKAALLPGMNVLVYLPVGSQVKGVVVAASAVVWWQGKAWVYVQRDSDHFVRREISTDMPVQDGWFVRKGLKAGERTVLRGAQALLSEEFRSRIQLGD